MGQVQLAYSLGRVGGAANWPPLSPVVATVTHECGGHKPRILGHIARVPVSRSPPVGQDSILDPSLSSSSFALLT